MEFNKFRERWANTSYNLNVCRSIALMLAFLVCFLVVQLLKVSRDTRVILVPPHLAQKVFVATDDASPAYLKEMADYVIYLATNYTPQTVESRLQAFMKYVAPEAYSDVQKQIKNIAEDSKFYGKTQAFYPERFKIDKQQKKIEVTGRLLKFYMGKLASDETTTFILKYRIRNGEFQVLSLYPKKKEGENR
ncbi:type IV conjugative transfer system protein TraE [Desulfurobacterium sp.]